MQSNNEKSNATLKNGLSMTRIFDAPRELVWRAWTDPQHMMRWWGPSAFSSPVCRIDLRVGGQFLTSMRADDGHTIYGTGVYREVSPFDRLVFTNCFADENGNVVPATYYGMGEDIPVEMLITVILESIDGKTKMTVTHEGLPSNITEDANRGWNESFDKLEISLH